ncbi:hypothetical protein SAMN04488168_15621 [Bacillus sp. 491mf]|uniref:hypothetical protein n=1 Tax=Bacillus TaxID=1386 RepID=UPI000555086F|nr:MULTISPECIES: hypothetical protein [unclassified Bacillus (in: firmicutes)]SFD60434.1 hypothetical protein SAMN04488168_15621 [Bacillus sp. 491mf]
MINSYERIKNSVAYGFEEYIDEEGLTVAQASAKILEEEARRLNYSPFTKSLYFVSIALEGLKSKQIADFIFNRLEGYFNIEDFEDSRDQKDIDQLCSDIELCKEMLKKGGYEIIETENTGRIEYILSLPSDF